MDRPAISRIGFHLSSSEPVLESGWQLFVHLDVAPIVVAIYSIGSTSSAGDRPVIA
jgi:hypothetical protein